MAGSIQDYAFINAKLRARISRFLTPELLDRIEHARTLTEAVELLKGGPYDRLAAAFAQTGDLKMSELALLRMEIAILGELERQVRDRVQGLIIALEMSYDIESLKDCLRLWFDRNLRKRDITESVGYLLREKICYDLQTDRLLAAASLEEVVQILKRTPYAEILAEKAEEVRSTMSLFPIEAALDQFYYRQLNQAIAKLNRADAEVAKRITGVEIDLLNITWITRFKHFYSLPLEQTMRLVIPHGRSIRRATIEAAYASPDPEAAVATLVSAQHPTLGTLLHRKESHGTARVILIERILGETLELEARRALAGYPFSVGVILAYVVLKRLEMRKIMSLLNAKLYRAPEGREAGRP